MTTIEDLIAEKENLELSILEVVNSMKKKFEDKTGAALQDITFSSTYVMEYGSKFNVKLFTDCECKIEYNGVKIGG